MLIFVLIHDSEADTYDLRQGAPTGPGRLCGVTVRFRRALGSTSKLKTAGSLPVHHDGPAWAGSGAAASGLGPARPPSPSQWRVSPLQPDRPPGPAATQLPDRRTDRASDRLGPDEPGPARLTLSEVSQYAAAAEVRVTARDSDLKPEARLPESAAEPQARGDRDSELQPEPGGSEVSLVVQVHAQVPPAPRLPRPAPPPPGRARAAASRGPSPSH
jgi:hypothetical protein